MGGYAMTLALAACGHWHAFIIAWPSMHKYQQKYGYAMFNY